MKKSFLENGEEEETEVAVVAAAIETEEADI